MHIPLSVGHMLGDHVATKVEQWRSARALLPVALGGREDPTAEGAPDEGGNQRALRGYSEEGCEDPTAEGAPDEKRNQRALRGYSEALRGHSEALMRADR